MTGRTIRLKGTKNTRDFCGIVNKEGKAVINKSFIRSDELSSLTAEDIKLLKEERKIKTVIDLRTELEVAEKPDKAIEGITNIGVPVFSESTMGITHEGALDRKKLLDSMPDMEMLYRRMVTLDECVEKLKAALRLIVDSDGGVLWHCTAGKDRCGMVSALFLSLLDVDRETIIGDYLLTNRSCFADAYGSGLLVLLVFRSFKKVKKAKGLLSAERRFIEGAFSAMEQNYGSVDAFIREALGITDEEKQSLKARVLK